VIAVRQGQRPTGVDVKKSSGENRAALWTASRSGWFTGRSGWVHRPGPVGAGGPSSGFGGGLAAGGGCRRAGGLGRRDIGRSDESAVEPGRWPTVEPGRGRCFGSGRRTGQSSRRCRGMAGMSPRPYDRIVRAE